MASLSVTLSGPEHLVAALKQPQASAIRAQALCCQMNNRMILHDLNFDISAGSYIALLGPNGAGKSTLLHILATLTSSTSGKLYLFDQAVGRGNPALRARIGMIGHQPMLYRDLTALENLVFFGKLYRVSRPVQRAEQLLQMVALSNRAYDPAKTFSRGMVQRLAIARALMHDPQLLLADEPFSGLDWASSLMLEKLLAQLHASGKTIVLTHHEIGRSLSLAQRAIVLRGGRIVLDQLTSNTSVQAVVSEMTRP